MHADLSRRCHGIMNCSISCPKGLDPAGKGFGRSFPRFFMVRICVF